MSQRDLIRALNAIEKEADIMQTHDPGVTGSQILHEAVTVLRRGLPAGVLYALVIFSFGCTQAPKTKNEAPTFTATPTVIGAPVKSATVQSWNCQAYAHSLLPWNGPRDEHGRAVFAAVNDALLPDSTEFAVRRHRACATLAEEATK